MADVCQLRSVADSSANAAASVRACLSSWAYGVLACMLGPVAGALPPGGSWRIVQGALLCPYLLGHIFIVMLPVTAVNMLGQID